MENKKEILDNHKWGGSGIEKELFEFILDEFEEGTTIVEIGAGLCSTKMFSMFFDSYSIEDNIKYVGTYGNAKYIHAPLKDGWYDVEAVKNGLPEKYDLIFLDGPLGSGNRRGFLKNIKLFNPDAKIIVHDTYREPEADLAKEIAEELGKEIQFFKNSDFWAYIY